MDIEKILMSVRDVSNATIWGELGHLPPDIRADIINKASKSEIRLIRNQISAKLEKRKTLR